MIPYLALTDSELAGKTVIVRMDFNCPPDPDSTPPSLRDTKRIDDHIRSTIIPLFNDKRNAPKNMVILAHQGRRGQPDCTTLRAHFEHCRSVLQPEQIKVFYMWEDHTDDEVRQLGDKAVASPEVLGRICRLRDRTILLLENVRFSEAEERAKGKSSEDFATNPIIEMLSMVPNRVAALDGFSVAHRAQPSVIGLANLGPLYAGPVVIREIKQLSGAVDHPETPMLLVVGGAKIDDSIQAIEQFLGRNGGAQVVVGGLVGLAFLHAQGKMLNPPTLKNIQKATSDLDGAVKKVLSLFKKYGTEPIKVPLDVAFAPIGGFREARHTLPVANAARANHEIGDIGIETIAAYNREIARSRTVVMNGPMGRYEFPPLALGTEEILRYAAFTAAEKNANVLIGGGDTGAALGTVEGIYAKRVKECSSGKAFLEVLASGNVEHLPGIRELARGTKVSAARD